MNQTQRYQATTVALLLILTAFYLYTLNNNTQLQQTIQQLQYDNTQLQHQINTLQTENTQQQNTITNLTQTLEALFNDLGLGELIITELNDTVASKNQLIIQYVNTLVDELNNFQYSRLELFNTIKALEDEIKALKTQLDALT